MKKIIYSTLIFFIFNSIDNFAQIAIPNGDFEKFTIDDYNKKYVFDSWKSYMFFNPSVTGTEDAYSGKAAIRVYNEGFSKGQAATEISNLNNRYPLKLKGFVKYFAGPGERVQLSINVLKKETSRNQTITYKEKIGWKQFTGSNTQYTPFEIDLNYQLSNWVYYNGFNIEMLEIEITSYDKINSEIEATDATYIIVDNLEFVGEINTLPRFGNGLPDNLENWSQMDNKKYPIGWVDGLNLDNEFLNHVSSSTEAVEGVYSMKLSADAVNNKYTLLGAKKFVVTDPNKFLTMQIKYHLGIGDTLKCFLIGKGFDPLVLGFQSKDLKTSDFREEKISLSQFAKDSICFIAFVIEKKSSESFDTYVLIDDLQIKADVLGVAFQKENLNDVVHAYPNPSDNGIFHIKNNYLLPMELFDINGKNLEISSHIEFEKITIDLGHHPRGVYFLKVGDNQMQKLVY